MSANAEMRDVAEAGLNEAAGSEELYGRLMTAVGFEMNAAIGTLMVVISGSALTTSIGHLKQSDFPGISCI
jgi:hypothetical protein